MTILRSVLAVLAGLMLISLIVEPLEFALVALAAGEMTTDPEVYFAVRNRPALLTLKLVYNTAAAIAGGFGAAWVAGRAPVKHAIALAVVQTTAFGWALATPALRRTTPDWMWAALIVLTFAGITYGAVLWRSRSELTAGRRSRKI